MKNPNPKLPINIFEYLFNFNIIYSDYSTSYFDKFYFNYLIFYFLYFIIIFIITPVITKDNTNRRGIAVLFAKW